MINAILPLAPIAQKQNMMQELGGRPSLRLTGHGKKTRVMPTLSVALTTRLVAQEQRLSANM